MHKLVDKIPNRKPKNRKKDIEIIIARENDNIIKEYERLETRSNYEHIYPFLALTIITMSALMIVIFPSFTGFFDYQTKVSSIKINKILMPGSSLDIKDINITNITSLKITGTHELDDKVKIILIWQENRFVIYDSNKYKNNSIRGFSIINISENKSEEREDYQKENETNNTEYSLTKTVKFKKVCLDTCHLEHVVRGGRIVIKSKRPVFIEKIIFYNNNSSE